MNTLKPNTPDRTVQLSIIIESWTIQQAFGGESLGGGVIMRTSATRTCIRGFQQLTKRRRQIAGQRLNRVSLNEDILFSSILLGQEHQGNYA
jgi:hypothetical protein